MATIPVDRATILRLAADTGLDPRTVKRAFEHGLHTLKAAVDRDRLQAAAKRLGVALP